MDKRVLPRLIAVAHETFFLRSSLSFLCVLSRYSSVHEVIMPA
jgi:hypothetical protein